MRRQFYLRSGSTNKKDILFCSTQRHFRIFHFTLAWYIYRSTSGKKKTWMKITSFYQNPSKLLQIHELKCRHSVWLKRQFYLRPGSVTWKNMFFVNHKVIFNSFFFRIFCPSTNTMKKGWKGRHFIKITVNCLKIRN